VEVNNGNACKWTIFQLYHGGNKLHFNEIMVILALLRADMLLHSDKLSWFESIILCSFSLILNREAANTNSISLCLWPDVGSNPQSTALSISLCLDPTGARTHNLPHSLYVFGLTRRGLEPTIYHTRGEHANHYTTAIRLGVIYLLFH
jgi:hypothetical protein